MTAKGILIISFLSIFSITYEINLPIVNEKIDTNIIINPCANLVHGTFAQNPKGCKYFYYCDHGESVAAYCPQNMWFNPDSGICDLPENVMCNLDEPDIEQPVPELEDGDINCPLVDTADIQFIPSNVSCGTYYICYHGVPIVQKCIADMHWNAKTQNCDYPENARCKIKVPLPTCPKSGQVFYPHPYECDYFIFCINGYSTVQQCPFYHHWDFITETCKWRDIARCASDESSKNFYANIA